MARDRPLVAHWRRCFQTQVSGRNERTGVWINRRPAPRTGRCGIHAAGSYQAFPKAARYKDFRVMLDKERDRIDAVKSHLAQSVGRALIRSGHTVFYRSIFDCMRDFLHDEAFDGHDRMLAKYLKPDPLILDDMGMKQLPPSGAANSYSRSSCGATNCVRRCRAIASFGFAFLLSLTNARSGAITVAGACSNWNPFQRPLQGQTVRCTSRLAPPVPPRRRHALRHKGLVCSLPRINSSRDLPEDKRISSWAVMINEEDAVSTYRFKRRDLARLMQCATGVIRNYHSGVAGGETRTLTPPARRELAATGITPTPSARPRRRLACGRWRRSCAAGVGRAL